MPSLPNLDLRSNSGFKSTAIDLTEGWFHTTPDRKLEECPLSRSIGSSAEAHDQLSTEQQLNMAREPTVDGLGNRRYTLSREHASRAFSLARALGSTLDPIRQVLNDITDDTPPHLAGLTNPETISYVSKHYPLAFAKNYFWKNLVKCCIALTWVERLAPVNIRRVIDVGCGPGTFMFAFSALARKSRLIGIDNNSDQLQLAQIFSSLSPFQKPTLIKADASRDLFPSDELYTASYVVTELDRDQRSDFEELIRESRTSSFLIVDYINVVEALAETLSESRIIKSKKVSTSVRSDIATLIGDKQISFGMLYATGHRS